MDITKLKVEISTDPLSIGYSGLTIDQIAVSLNTVNRSKNKSTLTSTQVLNAVDKAEFVALTTADKQLIWDILHIGDINPFGIEADLFVDAFGAGSNTIQNLSILRVSSISRAEELGIGKVKAGNIEEAKI